MSWYETIIAAHTAVTDAVSHSRRLRSDRYFVWQEDGADDLEANNRHVEPSMAGYTDLFTKIEFDPWAAALGASFDASDRILWRLSSVDYEEDTGFWHWQWRWRVLGG